MDKRARCPTLFDRHVDAPTQPNTNAPTQRHVVAAAYGRRDEHGGASMLDAGSCSTVGARISRNGCVSAPMQARRFPGFLKVEKGRALTWVERNGIYLPGKDQAARKGITPPQLPVTAPVAEFPDGALADHGLYSDVVLAHAALAGQIARAVTFDTMHFKHVRLGGTHLDACRMRDVRFDTCDLAEAAWEKAQLARIEMVDCRLLGFKASEARIQDALFKDCNATYALFWDTRFKAARFQTCALNDASFHNADLSGVVFDRCDLRGADFRGAKLVGTDFRGSQVEGMRVGDGDLRGAIIDPTQAAAFAGLLGLIVRWDE